MQFKELKGLTIFLLTLLVEVVSKKQVSFFSVSLRSFVFSNSQLAMFLRVMNVVSTLNTSSDCFCGFQ